MNGHSYKTNGKISQPIATDSVRKVDEEHRAYVTEEQYTPPSVPPARLLLGNITLSINQIAWAFYVQARFQQCRQAGILDVLSTCRSWTMFCFELVLLLPELLQAAELLLALAPSKAPGSRSSRRLVGSEAPLVHILVTYALSGCKTIDVTSADHSPGLVVKMSMSSWTPFQQQHARITQNKATVSLLLTMRRMFACRKLSSNSIPRHRTWVYSLSCTWRETRSLANHISTKPETSASGCK